MQSDQSQPTDRRDARLLQLSRAIPDAERYLQKLRDERINLTLELEEGCAKVSDDRSQHRIATDDKGRTGCLECGQRIDKQMRDSSGKMQKVFKYDVPIEDRFRIRMPRYSKILSFQTQSDQPQIWVLVDPECREYIDREFRLAGTGHPIKEAESSLVFVGTCQMREGALVWHLFEYIPF